MVPPSERQQRTNEIEFPKGLYEPIDPIVNTARQLEPGQPLEKAGNAIRRLFNMPEMSVTDIIRDTRYDAQGHERDRGLVEQVIENKFISTIRFTPQPDESQAEANRATEQKRQEYRELIRQMLDQVYDVPTSDMAKFYDGSNTQDKYHHRVVELEGPGDQVLPFGYGKQCFFLKILGYGNYHFIKYLQSSLNKVYVTVSYRIE